PKIYSSPVEQPPQPHYTFLQVFVGPGTAFEDPRGLRLAKDFPDGTSATFLVVEAGEAVPWTKPADLTYDPKEPLPPLGGIFRGGNMWSGWNRSKGFNVALADASVRMYFRQPEDGYIRGLITRNGGEKVDPRTW